MEFIDKLEKYFDDIPAHLQQEVREFLEEYYEKKDTHSATSLEGLSDEELGELLYLDLRVDTIKSVKKNFIFLEKCKKLKYLWISIANKSKDFDNLEIIPYLSTLKMLLIDSLYPFEITDNISKLSELLCLNFIPRTEIDLNKITNNKKILILDISNYEETKPFLNFFPNAIFKFINLISLEVSYHKLGVIPDDISQLRHLSVLGIRGNNLTEIPDEIFNFPKLKELSFGENQLTKFPFEELKKKKYEFLEFLDNPYLDFPEMNQIRIDHEGGLELFNLIKKFNSLSQISEDNYNYFNLKIPKAIQTPILQYIEFFKDYVEATKGKEIIFNVKREENGLTLITNGNTGVSLPELGTYFQEYVDLVPQDLERWIPKFEVPVSAMKADILRLKLENQVSSLKSSLNIAKLENYHLNNQLGDANAQIDFLRLMAENLVEKIGIVANEKSKVLSNDQLLLDIIDQLVKMLERKSSRKIENLHNDILTDFLRGKNYYAADQTRSGSSPTKLGVGEIDIMIRKKNGTPFSIIEAFRLKDCGEKNKKVAQHIDKLLNNYDTAGHERNYIVVYAEAVNFENLWKNYSKYVAELNAKTDFKPNFPLIDFQEKTEISRKTSIKIGLATHRREGENVEVYHIFVNMFA